MFKAASMTIVQHESIIAGDIDIGIHIILE
jgi:hypothetical protein